VISVCRQIYGAGTFVHSEITDLGQFPAGGLGAVLAWRCSVDVLDVEHRRTVLQEAHRVLAPSGRLIFSSHNRPDQSEAPAAENRARRGGGLLRNLRLRSSRAPMDERELGNELLSGIDGEPSADQYRIGRDEQEAQLGELGFRLIECIDLEGHAVPAGESAAESAELHYVAAPVPSPS
jgi:SAM-dependent methyltransferase